MRLSLRFITLVGLMVSAIVLVSPAQAQMRSVRIACQGRPVPVLCDIHQHRNAVWHYETLLGQSHTPYGWTAERAGASPAYRLWVRHRWYTRRLQWRARYLRAIQTPYPSWFASDMVCIGLHEEGGSNSVAGYYGLIYPPSGYIDPGPRIATTYGNSWLDVPRSPQLALSYSLYRAYGWQPWSTAPGCGL